MTYIEKYNARGNQENAIETKVRDIYALMNAAAVLRHANMEYDATAIEFQSRKLMDALIKEVKAK